MARSRRLRKARAVGTKHDGGGCAGSLAPGDQGALAVLVTHGFEHSGRVLHLPFQVRVARNVLGAEAPALRNSSTRPGCCGTRRRLPGPRSSSNGGTGAAPAGRSTRPGSSRSCPWETAHVDQPEVGADAWPAGGVGSPRSRSRSTRSRRPGTAARVELPPLLRGRSPAGEVQVIGAEVTLRLVVGVHAARRDRTGGLASDERLLGMLLAIASIAGKL